MAVDAGDGPNPYEAPVTPLASDESGPMRLVRAGVWRRVGAFLVDTFAAIVAANAFTYVMALAAEGAGVTTQDSGFRALHFLAFLLILVSYLAGFETFESQTIGKSKYAFNIKVADLHGRPIRLGRSLVRTSVKLLSVLLVWVVLLLGFYALAGPTTTVVTYFVFPLGVALLFVPVAASARGQALHDLAARTLVLRNDTGPVSP
jgi:uncharacterized RDD family membrane protein YckC